jgi:hypothetical protein
LRGLIAVAAIGLALASCGGARPAAHHPAGPPVTPEALRDRIERSGLKIEWHDGRAGDGVIADLAGEARDPKTGGHVAFELAVARGKAHVYMLGRSRYPMPDTPNELSDDVDARLRGVIRNVAYATWYFNAYDSPATDDVSARLDQAILSTFAATDAEAHPILESPPE